MAFLLDSATCPLTPQGAALPSGFRAPPGLEPPLNFCLEEKFNSVECEENFESDATSVGTGSFHGAVSSEHDETDHDEAEESGAPRLKAPFVPGPLPRGSAQQRTPLRKGADLFVPGSATVSAAALPFVPMATVQQSWQCWYDQNQPMQPFAVASGSASKAKRAARHYRSKK